MGKNNPLVHWSASAFSTAGVLTGHGPSPKVSTTSLSARKSSCLKCSKPKPGPPVVSTSTTRLTPSASGLAQGAPAGCAIAAVVCGAGAAAGLAAIEPVMSESEADLAEAAGLSAGASLIA